MLSAVISDYFSQIVLCLGIFFFSVYYTLELLFLIDISKIIVYHRKEILYLSD